MILYYRILVFTCILGISITNVNSQNQFLPFKEKSNRNKLTNSARKSVDPVRTVTTDDEGNIIVEYNFEGAYVAKKIIDGIEFSFIHIKGFSKMLVPGSPALPVHNDIIPYHPSSTGKVQLLESEYIDYKGYYIYPATDPFVDTEGKEEPKFKLDSAVYDSDEIFSLDIIDKVDDLKKSGVPMAVCQVRPVQFNPVTKTIRVYSRIRYRLINKLSEAYSETTDNLSNRIFYKIYDELNDVVLKNKTTIIETQSTVDYLIVTHDAYKSEVDRLADWKRQLGYNVDIISKNNWNSYKVNNSIKTRYNTCSDKPKYLLIFGSHTGNLAVPAMELTPPYGGDKFVTDLYYACTDGVSDYYPDMAHGRISVRNIEEAKTVVDKILEYEKNPTKNQAFYGNALVCSQFQDIDRNGVADRRFCHTTENIHSYLTSSQGYNVDRLYYSDSPNPTHFNNGFFSDGESIDPDLQQSSGFNWKADYQDITESINKGKFLLIHRDHGFESGNGWAHPYYTTTTMDNISNGNLTPVVMSINCYSGDFSNNECFAEKLLKMNNKGAVGVVAASNYSLSGNNDGFVTGMINSIWSNPGFTPIFGYVDKTPGTENYNYPTMGEIMNQGLHRMIETWGGTYESNRYTFEMYNWFGDPAMRMWTKNPHENVLSASVVESINCSDNQITINNINSDNVLITIVQKDKILAKNISEGDSITIDFELIFDTDNITVTLSKPNCLPFIDTVDVNGDCQYLPVAEITSVCHIGTNSAQINSVVRTDNSNTITETGIVLSTDPNPEYGADGSVVYANSSSIIGDYNNYLQELNSSTRYYGKFYAKNSAGISYSNQVAFDTDCGSVNLPYNETFNTKALPDCWQNNDNKGNSNVWLFNNPENKKFVSTTHIDGFAILDSDHYGKGNSQDADLISKTINLTENDTALYISFEHYFREWLTSSAQFYFSTDNGVTWNLIKKWTKSTDNSELFDTLLIDEIKNKSSIKFKWKYIGSFSYYWMIDDITIMKPNLMQLSSVTTIQADDSDNVYLKLENQKIIGVKINTVGKLSPLKVTSLTFNTNGTTSASDITKAKLYYSKSKDEYCFDKQFGVDISSPNGNFEILLDKYLSEGDNYFWLTYDITNNSSSVGNKVDAQCEKVVLNGTEHTPTVTSPEGDKTIVDNNAEWTWMIYLYEDKTGLNGLDDINELEANGSIENKINYIVLYDANTDSQDGIYYIKKDPDGYNNKMISTKVGSFGTDPDMNNWETMKDFVLWAKENYPANRYALTVWDHGTGIFDRAIDMGANTIFDRSKYKGAVGEVKLWEMEKALLPFVEATGQKFDIIGFDVCLLGQIETAYQMRNVAKYVIASEKLEPGDGWDYVKPFKRLNFNPEMSSNDIANHIVQDYVISYSSGTQGLAQVTQAATSVDKLNNELIPALDAFAESMKTNIEGTRDKLYDVIDASWIATYNKDHKDLGDFLRRVSIEEDFPDDVKTKANNAIDALNSTVISEGHSSTLSKHISGLKIWIPKNIFDEGTNEVYYTDKEKYLDFSNTKWDEFLYVIPSSMKYESSQILQNSIPIKPETKKTKVICLEITTKGSKQPIKLTSATFSSQGSTSMDKVARVKLWYTGSENNPSVLAKFGTTATEFEGNMVFEDVQILDEGKNYFWLEFEFSEEPEVNTLFDAECINFKIDETVYGEIENVEGYVKVMNIEEQKMPSGVRNEKSTCSCLFYDDGGLEENYSSNFNGSIIFKPGADNHDKKIFIDFSLFSMENEFDKMSIYNGSENNKDKLIGEYSGTKLPDRVMSTADDGTVLVEFKTDFMISNQGWSAFVYCNTVPDKPAKPQGIDKVCDKTEITKLQIPEVDNAIRYDWRIDPANAGEIINKGSQCDIKWAAEYTGDVSVTVSAGNGELLGAYSEPHVISVFNRPSIAMENDYIKCVGRVVQITATLTGDYPWNIAYSDGEGNYKLKDIHKADYSFGLNKTGSFTVDSLIDKNCSIPVSDVSFTVTEEDVPVAGFQFTKSGMDISFTSTTQNAKTFRWDFGDEQTNNSESNPVHTYNTEKEYYVSYYVENECGNDNYSSKVSLITDVFNDTKYDNVTIYPNPSSGIFNIKLYKILPKTTIEVISERGFIVYRDYIPYGQILKRIDLSHLSASGYIISIKNSVFNDKYKLIIK